MPRCSSSFAVIALLALLAATLPAQQGELTITTNSPLPSGTVGSPYSQTLQASGGAPPLTWAVSAGTLPAGLSLEAATGTISGTPTGLGTVNFQVRVSDSGGRNAVKAFSITIDPQALNIANDATLPRARVGVQYAIDFRASGGSPPYRNWRVTEGLLPAGLALGNSSGQLFGIPSAFGQFSFVVSVDDSAFDTASKRFNLTVDPAALTITTQSPLPLGTIGAEYRQMLTASGGPAPFQWEAIGPLPDGLSLNAGTGEISGMPGTVGVYEFEIAVTDAGDVTAQRPFTMTVADPAATITLEGETGPGEQAAVRLSLATAHPFAIAGQLGLTFEPDAINNSDDGTVLFSNNARSAQFTIAPGETDAAFPGGSLGLSMGTTGGTLTISVTALQTGSQAIPVDAESKLDIVIAQMPPAIDQTAIVNRGDTGFSLQVTGFSTAREVTRAVFRFTPVSGRTLQNPQATIDLNEPASAWYQDPSSAATGGAFVYTQPFTIQGDLSAIQSVAVTLTNSLGDSQSATVTF